MVAMPRGSVIHGLVSELRDVFHTAVDVAGAGKLIPAGHFKPEDGKSKSHPHPHPHPHPNPNPNPAGHFKPEDGTFLLSLWFAVLSR